jgi:diketogulonate reductase-like aldo/keto reductase
MVFKSGTDCFTLSNGVKIPCIGFGTWQTERGETAVNAVKAAIKAGYRHIDTAKAYGNEESVGEAIRESGVPRKELFLTSKFGDRHGYASAKEGLDKSLKRLGTDYLDLYLIHWPNPVTTRDHWEEANAEMWRGLEEAYKAGKVRALGLSNFREHHIAALLKTATIQPVVSQMRIAPGDFKKDAIESSKKRGYVIEAYSPLGGTIGGQGAANSILKAPVVVEIAEKYHKSTAQVAIRWCLEQGFLPLPKSTNPAHIAANLDVFDFALTSEEIEALKNMKGYTDPFPAPDETTW